jgi:hypothetical protein
MAAVCAVAYAVGEIIRYNIVHAEPVLAGKQAGHTVGFERISDLALVFAYVISVCLYLHILSSFVLGGFHIDTELNENILTTIIISLIMFIGVSKGLDELSIMEKWGLYVTLLIIVLLSVGFAWYGWQAWQSSAGISLFESEANTAWQTLTIVAGTLIVVQGFETPRYLADEYDSQTRVRASRWSQIISTIVYLTFIAVAMPLVHSLNGQYDDNSLIKLAGTASALLVAPLIIAAALSQFSAAVADTLAATGNMKELSHGSIESKYGTILVGIGAIALSWSANTLELIAFASRAFAFYYLLQCLVAMSVSKSTGRRIFMAVIAAVLGFITIFAVPAS